MKGRFREIARVLVKLPSLSFLEVVLRSRSGNIQEIQLILNFAIFSIQILFNLIFRVFIIEIILII